MNEVSVGQDPRPVTRRGVLGLGFMGTMGLPVMCKATPTEELGDFVEQRVVECVIWAMCIDETFFKEVNAGDFSSVEAHYKLSRPAKELLRRICAQGADAITTLRHVLTCEPAVTAREALAKIFEDPPPRCPIFPCPWW